MQLGYRIIRPQDVGTHSLQFAQISLWRTANWGVADGERAVKEAIEIARACKARGIRTVYHPLEYPLANEHASQTVDVMRRLAAATDLGIIIHDEGGAGRKRLPAEEEATFERNLREISSFCHVSIENSFNSSDVTWFWERFAVPTSDNVSITLDIGHLELAGVDSIAFVRNMPQHLIDHMRFVHMHHHNELELRRVKDHRPLLPDCREIEALKVLLKRKRDVWVILELDAAEDGMRQSIELLKNL
jgi:sugar phosphate isomerase/epimerase